MTYDALTYQRKGQTNKEKNMSAILFFFFFDNLRTCTLNTDRLASIKCITLVALLSRFSTIFTEPNTSTLVYHWKWRILTIWSPFSILNKKKGQIGWWLNPIQFGSSASALTTHTLKVSEMTSTYYDLKLTMQTSFKKSLQSIVSLSWISVST